VASVAARHREDWTGDWHLDRNEVSPSPSIMIVDATDSVGFPTGTSMTDENESVAVGESHPWRVAAIFVLPYLLLGVAWLGSNPAGAAPDENDHLVKALGIARLDIGADRRRGNLTERNASLTTRFVTIPSRLLPSGLTCFKGDSQVTAACQPHSPPTDVGDVSASTAVGGYPPFLYLPMGLAAEAADTPVRAFAAARGIALLEAGLLLWLACTHLVGWLGRRALAGVAVLLTPMAVFCMAIVSTSGLEIFGALGVVSVVVVASRRPESLKAWRTQLTLLISGSTLILSRQFGVVTMGALLLLLLGVGGWRPVWEQFRHPRPLFVATVAALGTSTLVVALWERKFDNPGTVGPWASFDALAGFLRYLPYLVYESVGWFGWLDTPMPLWSALAWAILILVWIYLAFIHGGHRDRWVLAVTMTATTSVVLVTHSLLFFPFSGGVQARHILPLLAFGPVFAGVVLTERLGKKGLVRVFTPMAVLLPAIQFVGLYSNARRYAVGESDKPLVFFGNAQWEPAFGWYPWLLVGLVGCVLLGSILIAFGRTAKPSVQVPRNPLASQRNEMDRDR
jgi:Predicted membrane protein (DUF2142)